MPLLRISNELYKDSDLMNCLFWWLKNEYHAEIKEIEQDDRVISFKVSSDEIPYKRELEIICTRIVDNVYSFQFD